MPTEMRLDPELENVIQESRRLAESSGDLRSEPPEPFQTGLPHNVATVIRQWVDDGGYDEAVAGVTGEDPDLADE